MIIQLTIQNYHEFKGQWLTLIKAEKCMVMVFMLILKSADPRKKEDTIEVPFTGKKEVTFDQVIKPKEEYLNEEIVYKKEKVKEILKEPIVETPFFEAKAAEQEKIKPTQEREISRLEEIKPEVLEVETFALNHLKRKR